MEFVSEIDMTKEMYGEKTNMRWLGIQLIFGLWDAYDKGISHFIKYVEGFPMVDCLRGLRNVGNTDFEV